MRSDELVALAERALVHVDGEALVTARRDLRIQVLSGTDRTSTVEPRVRIEVLVVRDGRTGTSVTDDPRDDGLRAVVADAMRRADAGDGRAPFPGLPAPAPARGHDGFDPPRRTSRRTSCAPSSRPRRGRSRARARRRWERPRRLAARSGWPRRPACASQTP